MPKTERRLAILGAGPIGLEAALYARALQIPFTIYERGRPADHVWRWGHVRLFTPFGMNSTPLGRAAAQKQKPNQALPGSDVCTTGRELISTYLGLIAESLGNVQTDTLVLQVGRRGHHKQDDPGGAGRGKQPFRLLLRDKQNRERGEEADVVLDCTGIYGQHRWLGAGGIPAAGELATEPHISYTLDDILGDRKNHYANKNILVVGGGLSAATTVSNLAQVALDNQSTWVTWIARGANSWPIKRIANDPLKGRDRLAVRANNLATRTDANVEFHAQTVVDAIESQGPDKGFRVTIRSAGKQRAIDVERIIGNVGYSPDRMLYRELQIQECYATFAPAGTAAYLRKDKQSAGPESLRNPEPNYFILGAKSYGRNADFLLPTGFDQVRDVFKLITGDPALDLYGVSR
jgi:cation diffusion facilitator CzcD-associated flavoprotein CzcO